jgi:hypothetical protein
MAMQALQNQRRPEQHIEVTFDDRQPGHDQSASTPRTPDEIAPPADTRVPEPPADLRVPEPPADLRVPEPRGVPDPPADSVGSVDGRAQ